MNKRIITQFLKKFPGAFLCQKKNNNAVSGFRAVDFSRVGGLNPSTDIYFYVNGGPKQSDITRINAFFVDLDAGRDEKKSYFPKKVVDKKKKEMMKEVKKFPVRPSMIVETRNGYHLYWITEIKLSPNNYTRKIQINQWETVQKRIASFFKKVGADYKVLKLNQILRVPGSSWHKTYEGKSEIFNVQLIENNNQQAFKFKFTLEEMLLKTKSIKILPPGPSYSKPKGTMVAMGEVTQKNSTFKSSPHVPLKDSSYTTQNSTLLQDIHNYLNETAGLLWSKGAKFSSKQAKELAQKLSSEYGVS